MSPRRPAAHLLGMTASLVYSTTTGQEPTGPLAIEPEHDATPAPSFREWNPYCFVCSRPTDHFAEHDDLVEAGLAYYDADGTVCKTDAFDREKANEISEATYQRYLATLTAESPAAVPTPARY